MNRFTLTEAGLQLGARMKNASSSSFNLVSTQTSFSDIQSSSQNSFTLSQSPTYSYDGSSPIPSPSKSPISVSSNSSSSPKCLYKSPKFNLSPPKSDSCPLSIVFESPNFSSSFQSNYENKNTCYGIEETKNPSIDKETLPIIDIKNGENKENNSNLEDKTNSKSLLISDVFIMIIF